MELPSHPCRHVNREVIPAAFLSELGRGMSEADLLRGHTQLTHEHIRAALLYAAAVIGMEETLYR